MLASRLPVRDVWQLPLPSDQERQLLVAELYTGGTCASGTPCTVSVACTHLESLNERQTLRDVQADVLSAALAEQHGVLLLGALNPQPPRQHVRLTHGNWVDVWSKVNADEPG